MMRRFIQLGLVATAIAAMTGTALASPIKMTLSSGATSVSGLTFYPTMNAAGYTNPNFNGWDIYYQLGTSNSPTVTPFGIDLGGEVAACTNASGCDPLTVSISDVGFTSVVSNFSTTVANNQTGSGWVTQQAYYDLGNQYFNTSGAIAGSANPLMVNGTGTDSMMGGGPAGGASPYSLTLIETFNTSCTMENCASFSVDGNITGNVPEPGTLALFGAGLLGMAWLARRRWARQR